jgi:hypothetical protein
MKKITTFALTGSVTAAFLAAAAVAQDTSSSSDPMMQGESDMEGMMPMMEACTEMMRTTTDQIEGGAPEARKG